MNVPSVDSNSPGAQVGMLQQVTENLEEILSVMQGLAAPTAVEIESLSQRLESISSELDLDCLFDNLSKILGDAALTSVKQWKKLNPQSKVAAFFPVYAPLEILHAAGMLPIAMASISCNIRSQRPGANDGSTLCSMLQCTLATAMQAHRETFGAFVFTSLCGPAENLYSLFRSTFSEAYVACIHLPEQGDSSSAVDFLTTEYRRLIIEIEDQIGRRISDADLGESIRLYNSQRHLLGDLYSTRADLPHLLTGWECYLISNAASVLPVKEHILILQRVLRTIKHRRRQPKKCIRLVLEGFCCEQPSIQLTKVLEAAGSVIVEDDFAIAQRCHRSEVSSAADPVRTLAASYLKSSVPGVRHGGSGLRWHLLAEKVHRAQADAVAMFIPNSCPAAFLDYLHFRKKLRELGIPLLSLSRTQSGSITLLKESDFMSAMAESVHHKDNNNAEPA